jgi:hypothetical protein
MGAEAGTLVAVTLAAADIEAAGGMVEASTALRRDMAGHVEATPEALEFRATPAWLECKHLQVFRNLDYSRCLAGCNRHLGRECRFPIAATTSLAVMGAGETIAAEAGIAVAIAGTITTGEIADGALTDMRLGMSTRIPM